MIEAEIPLSAAFLSGWDSRGPSAAARTPASPFFNRITDEQTGRVWAALQLALHGKR
jgi:hypothetical protein